MKEVRVGVRDLKARLRHYLDETMAGRNMVVIERARLHRQHHPEGKTIESRTPD